MLAATFSSGIMVTIRNLASIETIQHYSGRDIVSQSPIRSSKSDTTSGPSIKRESLKPTRDRLIKSPSTGHKPERGKTQLTTENHKF